MRIVIDLQGAQAENRHRGIGRYSLSLALSIARHIKDHELFIALNGAFPESISPIREAFEGLIPNENVTVWSAPTDLAVGNNHTWQRQTAMIIRDAFLATLRPDVVLVSSPFEGFANDAITDISGISSKCLKAVVLYDLIPLIHPEVYLKNSAFKTWYNTKLQDLKLADCWFSISDSSRREGIEFLGLPEDRVISIGTDADESFRVTSIAPADAALVQSRHGINKPFVMYTGGIDHRKNIPALIRAFAALPIEARKSHQLAIVCAITDADRVALTALAKESGLGASDIVFTGFVNENDLVALYNLCKLFVFPSWHEGFGLPALEAMRCGAPVIAGNLSSLPEVIGWDEALFDPLCEVSIKNALQRGLEDEIFRQALKAHGTRQAKNFSWNLIGQKFVSSIEALFTGRPGSSENTPSASGRQKLAYVSPLPPERSGIADYSAELLPFLAEFYDIDVIVMQAVVSDRWINENCRVRTVDWLVANANEYERVIYHFGNSAYHQHMFDLIERVPGVVILHDFFLSGLVSMLDGSGIQPGLLDVELYQSHGYPALKNRSDSFDPTEVIWKYPCNLSVVQSSLGTIVHSEHSRRLCQQWYNTQPNDWAVIPLLRTAANQQTDKASIKTSLGFKSTDFIVCSFGLLGPTKLNHRLVSAWINSALASSANCHLVFVGENEKTPYGRKLSELIGNHANTNIHITGWVDPDSFKNYLNIADASVQLRTLSRGETSAAVLDCMNYGIPTIINCNGSFDDISDDAVFKLPDSFSDDQLIEALESLWQNEILRKRLAVKAQELIQIQHAPEKCAAMYQKAIEFFYSNAQIEAPGIPDRVAKITAPHHDEDLADLAKHLSISFAPRIHQRQLLIDISELVQRDAASGIQRVVKSILQEWLSSPPAGYRVEPVYASPNEAYRYARRFTLNFLGCTHSTLEDDPIDFSPGDVLFVLDLQPEIQVAQANYYQWLRDRGVVVKFMVYDLLCVTMPQYFSFGADTAFNKWLHTVANSDGAICISKSVSTELNQWMLSHTPNRLKHFDNRWFHLGADLKTVRSDTQLPHNVSTITGNPENSVSFLMVGTIEPRKGHEQILDAFDVLWNRNININLIIVGKQGWLVDQLISRLKTHDALNRKLFWLHSANDEHLEALYRHCNCLIAASYGEGFGLPLIEAAHHSLPVLARDIPVFREVAGNSAYFFNAESTEQLVGEIQNWLTLYNQSAQPSSKNMTWKHWNESADWLATELLCDRTIVMHHTK